MLKTKIAGFANSVDLKEATQNDLPHLNLNGPQVFKSFFCISKFLLSTVLALKGLTLLHSELYGIWAILSAIGLNNSLSGHVTES